MPFYIVILKLSCQLAISILIALLDECASKVCLFACLLHFIMFVGGEGRVLYLVFALDAHLDNGLVVQFTFVCSGYLNDAVEFVKVVLI